MFKGTHVLIIVENLAVPFDRRVWQEAGTLKENGAYVSIICPKMKGFVKPYEQLDGIDIYRHYLPLEANGALGYLLEYSIALFWEFILSCKIYSRKKFNVIHGCNPPDLIFLIALFFKLFGVKYVFDHHDINPELYIAKYNKRGFFYKSLLLMERLTFATANYSIATNESYREIAILRGKMSEEKVQVVRSGPNLKKLKLAKGDNKYKKGRKFLIGYVGVIGEQEGLDLLLKSVKEIISLRQDVQFAIIGSGTELDTIKRLTSQVGLEEYVDFYGRVDDEMMIDILSTADVCVNPDRPTVMNNLSTMNKIMEYMALRKPIVQYDLKEGRASAKEASLYAENTNTTDFANKLMWLLDHPEERKERGEHGFRRVQNELSWECEAQKLLIFYKKVLGISK